MDVMGDLDFLNFDSPVEKGPDSKIKILFVDDEISILVALRRLCRNTDWDIYTAESGDEGLAVISEHTIDLVVSDMRMPKMNGAEFLEQVVKQSPSTVRILLTGYSDVAATIAAIDKGKIFCHCTKPWDNDEFREILKEAIASR
jgi:response regulator RpfG family c-di-GMP phosphodiesterase